MSTSHLSSSSPMPLGALAAGIGLSLLSTALCAQEAPPPSAALPASAAAVNAPAEPSTTPAATQSVRDVVVKSKAAPAPEGKHTYQATTTNIGKGKQALRDIPQSITVVTEKLITDRHLDTVKEVLHQTAGITFQAAEGGEEDIRLRGFSLQTTGDIFLDGVRDPAIYDRDTFNLDHLELLRGSASMLFGRGSTGGAVNQVSKTPYLEQASEVNLSAGNFNYLRATGDFNIPTAEDAALRITAMKTKADNNGAGSSIDKQGIAGAYRWHIGEKMEHQVSFYHLENNNGINYGLPWMKPHASDTTSANTVNSKLDPSNYYGMDSDYNHTQGDILTYTNTLRLGGGAELKSVLRHGEFERDLRASTIRLVDSSSDLSNFSDATAYRRGSNTKIQRMSLTQGQIDYTAKHKILGLTNAIATGIDYSHEKRKVYGITSGNPTKPTTTAGTPDDGAWIDEGARTTGQSNGFTATGMGAYLQDLVQVAPHWKVLGGLRYDMMKGDYKAYTAATGVQTAHWEQNIYEWSKRFGVLFQPTALQSYHLSYGTSFNTSGDAYSYNQLSANTPPESSENIELGSKLDSEDGRLSGRIALFRATKNNERNTDTDTTATAYLLSGKRHATGLDMDITGQITDDWEIYASYTWIPEAKVDKAAPTASTVGNREGDRPGMTPVHSGTVWNTYRFLPAFRAGLGVNFRSKESPADLPGGNVYTAPGYATVDLMGEYTFSPKYILKANVTNVGNKLYGDQLYRGHYVPGAGRLVQFTLTAKF